MAEHQTTLTENPLNFQMRFPCREEDIVAARTAELQRHMQITLQGLKTSAEQET